MSCADPRALLAPQGAACSPQRRDGDGRRVNERCPAGACRIEPQGHGLEPDLRPKQPQVGACSRFPGKCPLTLISLMMWGKQ